MRNLSAKQQATLKARAGFATFLRVYVQDGEAVWQDTSTLLGRDWGVSAEWDDTLDNNVPLATVVFMKGTKNATMSPLAEDSVLNLLTGGYSPLLATGRYFRIQVATVPSGTTPEAGGVTLLDANPDVFFPRVVTLGAVTEVVNTNTSGAPSVALSGTPDDVPDDMAGTVRMTVVDPAPTSTFSWTKTSGDTDPFGNQFMYPGGIAGPVELYDEAAEAPAGINVEWTDGDPYASGDAWDFTVTVDPAHTETSDAPTLAQAASPVLTFAGRVLLEVAVGAPTYSFTYTLGDEAPVTTAMLRGTAVPLLLDGAPSGLTVTWPNTTAHYAGATWEYAVAPSDWAEVFKGRIDTVRVDGGDSVTVVGRDLAGLLVDAYLEEEVQYGSDAGVPLQTVCQSILDDNGYSGVGLYTPVDPLFDLGKFLQRKDNLMGALLERSRQIGWDVRYRWRDADADWRLTLYSPDRLKSSADWAVPDYAVWDSSLEVGESAEQVRNAVRVVYTDRSVSPPVRSSVEATNPTSISLYTRRFMEIAEGATSNIDTEEEAQRLADVAIADLSLPVTTVDMDTDLYWHLEVGDMLEVPPLKGVTTSTILGAVYSIRHRIAGDRCTTRVSLYGQPRLSKRAWAERDARPRTAASAPFTGPSAPTGVTATPVVNGMAVTFEPATTGAAWDAYELHVGTSAGFTTSDATRKATTKTTRFEVTDLAAGSTYYAKVVPLDAKKNAGPASAEVSLTARYVEPRLLQPAISYAALPLNADFEAHNSASLPPDAWAMVAGTWGTDADALSSGSYSGTRAVEISATSVATRLGSQLLAVRPGDLFYGTAIVQRVGGTGAHMAFIGVEFFDSALASQGTYTIQQSTFATSWAEIGQYAQIEVPSTGRYARLIVGKGSSSLFGMLIDSSRITITPQSPDVGIGVFLGSWTGMSSPQPTYYRDPAGRVFLTGGIMSGAIPSSAFQLPAKYRPGHDMRFVVASGSGTGVVTVTGGSSGGTVSVQSGDPASVYLDGISFRAEL